MTNREAHEQAAGMGLEESFFRFNGIDPEGEYGPQVAHPKPRTIDDLVLERAFIYNTIHHRDMQPYEYSYALEVELARVRLVLRKIQAESRPSGEDFGNSAVLKLAEEGLKC